MAGYKPKGVCMSSTRLYETVFVLHAELSEEDVAVNTQNIVSLLEGRGAEIIRTERGGKRRLAYPIHKQRYGYYNLIHFRAGSEALVELERLYRLSDRVIRYLTLHVDKEEQLTSLTHMGDDDGRDDERDDRRRGGRRGDSYRHRAGDRERELLADEDEDESDDDDDALGRPRSVSEAEASETASAHGQVHREGR
jgi:small subunit ribosomal protein S6